MSDISACNNEFCKNKLDCHRYTASRCEYWQSMIIITGEQSKETCDMFWSNEGYRKDPKRFNQDGNLK